MLKEEIGATAGLVYQHLASNGEASLSQLERSAGASRPQLVSQAVGWLMREDKLAERWVGRTLRLRLNE